MVCAHSRTVQVFGILRSRTAADPSHGLDRILRRVSRDITARAARNLSRVGDRLRDCITAPNIRQIVRTVRRARSNERDREIERNRKESELIKRRCVTRRSKLSAKDLCRVSFRYCFYIRFRSSTPFAMKVYCTGHN